jgi:hypothetical protein
MKKNRKINSLRFQKQKIANLTKITAGADFPIVVFTVQRQCLSLVGYYTCETGLHDTCDESIRICQTDG